MSDLHARHDQFLVALARIVFKLEQSEPDAVVHPVPLADVKAAAGATDAVTEDAVHYLAARGFADVVPYPSGNRDLVITRAGKEAADQVGGSYHVTRPD
jgi:hypothetical protein